MDEGTREGSETVGASSEEGQRSPEEIRRDIEEARADLGDTVEALAAKADVKGQAKGRVDAAKQRAKEKKDEFVSKAKEATPEGAAAGAQQVGAKAQEKPLPFAVGGALVAGFVLGRLTSRR